MSSNKQFAANLSDGEIGEVFVNKYIGRLLKAPTLLFNRENSIEGADIYTIQIGLTGIRSSGIEVKALSKSTILQYGNRNIPTIPFELFSSNDESQRQKWNPGWLYAITHPKKANESHPGFQNGLKAVTPGTLLFLYYQNKISASRTPFVSIAFEDVPKKLIPRLKNIMMNELGFDLERWDLPEPTDSTWKTKPSVHKNIWNVPLNKLADLATVTMINDVPTFSDNNNSLTYIRARLEYLITLAHGRHLDTHEEDERVEEIYNTVGQKVHYFELPQLWIERHLYDGEDEWINEIQENQ